MPVKITDVRIKNEFRTESVDWLLANLGDKITVELDMTVETSIIASSESTQIFNATDGLIATGGTEWIVDRNFRFIDVRVGDTISVYEYDTSLFKVALTVIEKLDDSTIRVNGTTGYAANSEFAKTVISVTTPITACRYKWNFIENSDQPSFLSKVDGTEQLLVAKEIDATDTVTVLPMEFIGVKPYQIGSATIKGDGVNTVDVYQSKFKIVHETYITPFILATQLENIQNIVAPDYFFNEKCLKGIFDIEAMYEYSDPNRIQTVELTEVIGNSGWFNENFNTSITKYSVDSVVYKKLDNTVISNVQLSDVTETQVEVIIKNATDSPFSNTNTKFTVNFCKIPFDESEYTANTRTLNENFVFDRKLQTLGSGAVNGDNFGGDYQVLKSITGTFVSSSEIRLNFNIALSTIAMNVLDESEEARYMIWIAVQDHTLATQDADKVALLADQNTFFTDATDDGMIVNKITMLRHWESDCDTQGTSPKAGVAPIPETKAIAKLPSGYYTGTTGTFTITITSVPFGVQVFTSSLAPYLNAVIDVANQINADASGFKVTNSGAQGIIAPAGYGTDPNNAWDVEWSGSYLVSTPNPISAFFKGGIDEIAGVAGQTIDVFPEDEVVFCNQFYIDKNGRQFDNIILKKITTAFKVVNQNTQEEFTLDTFSTDLSAFPFISGNQYINFSLDKVYHIPSAEPRKAIKLMRRVDLDAGGKYYYEFEVPYLIRWEYWKAQALASGDFFDVGEPNNGWNQFWHHYNTLTDWKLTYAVEIKATKNGDNLTFKSQALVGSNDYDTNPDWDPNTIKSYRDSDNTLLDDGFKKYILGYEATRIEAEFTKVSGTPVLADIKVVLGLEVFEEGGIEGRRRISSVWVIDADTWWLSVDGSDKAKLTLTGNTVKAEALIDFSKILLDKQRYKITARLYETVIDTDSKQFQDGGEFVFQDDETYIFEDQ